MCDCALGSIEPPTAPQTRGSSSFWKLAALRRSLRSLLRAFRRERASVHVPVGGARP